MNQTRIKLVIGSLLHDIGKVLYRSGDGRNHSQSGYEYLKEEIHIEDQDILDQVLYHHAKKLCHANIKNDSLAYITYIADNISSAADRRTEDDSQVGFDKSVSLESIFNHFKGNNEKKSYALSCIEEELNYPTEKSAGYDENSYLAIYHNITENLKGIEYTVEYLDSLLEVLENNLSFVPSSTNLGETADISLYDHVKIAAAIAACIEQFLVYEQIQDYKNELFDNTEGFYHKKAFLLASIDFSGIQKFIYTIQSKNALKMLRSRSFYLEILMEHVTDEILDKTDLTRANVVYSGGGHAYFILPNTQDAINAFNDYIDTVNNWLLANFDMSLYLAHGCVEASADDLMNREDGSYRGLFRKVSEKISSCKSHRYTADQIRRINSEAADTSGRECRICRTSRDLNDEGVCAFCSSLINMSKYILYKGFYAVSNDETDGCVKLPGGTFLEVGDFQDTRSRIKDGSYRRVYTKNEPYTGLNISKRLWVGDYTSGESFEELAKASMGIDRIAVLRADVDDLGDAFVNGFKSADKGDKYTTLSRNATFSRKLSMFFKYHINYILKNGSCFITGSERDDRRRKATIVYSGGDDVFVVGAWDDVIGFAVDLRNSLDMFSQGALSISAGVGIYPGKYPVSTMASQTGRLEDAAKAYPDADAPKKNAIALFDDSLVFDWDEFTDKVIGEKLTHIRIFFDRIPEKGKAFLYRILELMRGVDASEDGRINLARMAYVFARLRDESKEKKEMVTELSETIYNWIKDKKERKQLEAAIYLYVYQIRD